MQQVTGIQQDYVFDRHCVLPKGKLTLTILGGDAWVFTEGKNFILRTGEHRTISTGKSAPIIRRAYTRGFAKFQVEFAS